MVDDIFDFLMRISSMDGKPIISIKMKESTSTLTYNLHPLVRMRSRLELGCSFDDNVFILYI